MLQSRKGFNQPRVVPAEQEKEAPQADVKKEQAPVVKATPEAKKPTLRDQFSFVLYACAKETTRKYKVMLQDTGLTYTQYIAMHALWDTDNINVKTLGEQLYLDSGTLTPMLRKMEKAGFVARKRNVDDERNLYVHLTEKGKALQNTMLEVEKSIQKELPFTATESRQLLVMLGKILDKF